jgi:SAM-dependent methyltransferase
MAQPRAYYAPGALSATFYDLVTASDASIEGDISIYAGLAPPGGSVLELGCGTGRIAFPLAEQGLSVTGIDLAPAMLDQARARLSAASEALQARIQFRLGDLTSLDLKRTFDVVICPFYTLAHLPAGAAWRNAFQVMSRHLAPGGRCAVHLPLGDLMRSPPPPRHLAALDRPTHDGGRLQIYVLERRYREPIGRFDQVVEYVELDRAGRPARRSTERLTYYDADPQPFAQAAGLRVEGAPLALGDTGHVHVFAKA